MTTPLSKNAQRKASTRADLITEFQSKYGMDISKKLRVKIIDHTGNPLAPEATCYKLYFTDKTSGIRRRFAYWPNTVGYQGF